MSLAVLFAVAVELVLAFESIGLELVIGFVPVEAVFDGAVEVEAVFDGAVEVEAVFDGAVEVEAVFDGAVDVDVVLAGFAFEAELFAGALSQAIPIAPSAKTADNTKVFFILLYKSPVFYKDYCYLLP